MICSSEFVSSKDQNNRFSNARQNVQYYQILTGHFKNPSDIISACLGSQVNHCVITFLLEKCYSQQKAIKQ